MESISSAHWWTYWEKNWQMVATLISYGVLITFQGSNPTGTSALISYIKPNNMSFLNNTHQV